MTGSRLIDAIFLKIAPTSIRHVEPVRYASSTGLVRDVYEQMQRDFQLVPPVTLHSSIPEVLAGVWCVLRETLLAGPVARSAREAVASGVSSSNRCPFCVDVHTSMLHGASAHGAARAILEEDPDRIADPWLRDLVRWARATGSGVEALTPAPFSASEAPVFMGTALAFHYINRLVNIFLDDSPFPLPRFFGLFRRIQARLTGALVGRPTVEKSVEPGASLELLPDTPLPAEFCWAEPDPVIAGAFARFAHAVEEAARGVLPTEAMRVVEERVQEWNGEPPGPGDAWLERALDGLDDSHRPLARLPLLSALASYRIQDAIVEEFRTKAPRDADLIAAASWGALVATRRISSWLV